jgi:hypothetical protein
MGRVRRWAVVVAATAALLWGAAHAHAQGTGSETAATALFDEGRKLMDKGNYAEACPKLAESERLAPSGGTLINLAECYEHTGQTASAWVAWKDAAARANTAGKRDVEQRALKRAAALEAGLARLTIAVAPGSDVAGLQVKRDGEPIGHAEFGLGIPIDPGSHSIEASAPGKATLSTKVDVAKGQTDARVTVTLADAPTPPASSDTAGSTSSSTTASTGEPPPEKPASSGGSTQRVIGLVLIGAGVVGVVVGSIFGLQAKSKNDEALQSQNCRTSSLCTQQGLTLTNDAKNAATISTIGFAAGGAAIAGGLIVWLLAPSSSPRPAPTTGLRVTPQLAPAYGGVTVGGAW